MGGTPLPGEEADFEWETLGSYEVTCDHPTWALSHCQCPTAFPIDESLVRVFVACRDADQVSRIGYVDAIFQGGEFRSFSKLSPEAVLSTGDTGCFDEHGVYPSTVLRSGGQIFLFYAGYTRGCEQPLFYTSIGLAVSSDGRTFRKYSAAPLLSRSEHDPCLVTSPAIYPFGAGWIMYYVSGFKWFRNRESKLQSKYDIKIARSRDLFDWQRSGQVAIGLENDETNISRPTVLVQDDGSIHMWYCHVRGTGGYRIGHATSIDGLQWTRSDWRSGFRDAAGTTPQMQAYPNVFRMAGRTYMLFNGSSYGASGFLIAEMKFK